MSKEETMAEMARLIAARHADTFASIHAAGPNLMSEWSDFSPLEQAKATALVDAVIDALMEPSDELLEAAGLDNDNSGAPFVSNFNYFRDQLRAMLSKAKEGTGE